VARAFDLGADQFALVQRAAIVRADVVDGVDRTVELAERNASSARFDYLDGTFRDLIVLRDSY
jgi:hypothetical protein